MQYIERDITTRLLEDEGSYIQVLLGPRQCGKSTLLEHISKHHFIVTFDDLQLRQLAQQDPALFLSQYRPPLLIDEVQYAPNLFPELKRVVDNLKKDRLATGRNYNVPTHFRLTGSNQIFMDKNVKESLVGRASLYYLNTLTIHELQKVYDKINFHEVMYKGGWPELYINPKLNVVQYLNDYIRSYIEKDVVMAAGITKQNEFHILLGLLAARTGQLLNHTALAQQSGVKSVTIKDWISILQRNNLVDLLQPYENNLNKRLVKTPKFYFLDTGLAARLQGWSSIQPMMQSPQAGPLFENLVFAEISKLISNFGKSWRMYLWRTREGEEIDFIIVDEKGNTLALDAKLGVQSVKPVSIPPGLHKTLPNIKMVIVVTPAGEKHFLTANCLQLPISKLTDYLLDYFS